MNERQWSAPQGNSAPGLDIEVGGHQFSALAERALYWPSERMLMIADLHLGKSDTFRAFGVAVPQAVQCDDLARLQRALSSWKIQTLVVLGDFVHDRIVSEESRAAWANLRDRHPKVRFVLIRGNHDRFLRAADWNFDDVLHRLNVNGVLLSHDVIKPHSVQTPFSLNVYGHFHPVFRARGWTRALPAMVHTGHGLALPAFTAFAAGMSVHTPQSRVWIFNDEAPWVARVQ